MSRTRAYLRPLLISFIALFAFIMVNFQNYNKPYQISYIMDLYTHSQWNIKYSTRSIGDDYLYQAAAYHILTTGKIAEINSEVPPLGKYLYSISLITFGTPYYALPPIYLLSSFLIFSIALRLFGRTGAWLALALFLSEPIIGLQVGGTLLDLPQLCWLLLHVWFLLRYIHAPSGLSRSICLLAAGVFLGFFVGTKFGLLVLAILAADFFLLSLHRKLLSLFPLLFVSAITYLFLFIPYFLEKESFIAWINLERARLGFYKHSFTPYLPGSGIVSLFTPWFFIWWGTRPSFIREWNLWWPLSLLSLLSLWWLHVKELFTGLRNSLFPPKVNKDVPTWQTTISAYVPPANTNLYYLLILSTALLLFTVAIPFWPRYLIIVLPFLYLLTVPVVLKIWQRLNRIARYTLLTSIVLIQVIRFAFIITPSASESVSTYQQWFEKSLYQDIYESIIDKKSLPNSRDEFHKQVFAAENGMSLRGKSVQLSTNPLTFPWETKRELTLNTTYHLPIGDYRVSVPFTLVREYNHWRIQWSWSYVLPDFLPTDKLSVQLNSEDLCQIALPDGRVTATYQLWPVLYLLPEVFDKRADRESLLIEIDHLTGLIPPEIEGKYKASSPDDLYTRIAPLKYNYVGTKLESLLEIQGIVTKNEYVWLPTRDLSSDALTKSFETTSEHKLDQSPIPGQLIRERRNQPNSILFENQNSNQTCRYTVSG